MATDVPAPITLPVGTDEDDVLPRWRRLPVRVPLAIGIALVAFVVIVSVGASVLAPYPPNQQDLLHILEPPFSPGHLLGTDQFGRDELSRVLYAGRIDLLIAFGATIVTFTFGTLVGLVAGASGGVVDAILMRIVDVFFAFPLVVLVLAIVAILGSGLLYLLIAMWAVTWVSYARIVRAEVMIVKHQDYVTAARALGYSRWRTMFRHIIPNAIAPAIVYGTIDAVNNVGIGAALGFLGLGVQDPTAEWGKMIADSQNFIRTAWWLSAVPGIAIVIFGLGLSIIGDALADSLRGEGHQVTDAAAAETVLEVRDLRVAFTGRARTVRAVNGVDFTLTTGETLGIVGESGCGKSAVLRALIGLHAPKTTDCTGSIRYGGTELLGASDSTMRRIRGAEISMIFQDPMSYLNPVLTISEQIGETLQRHTSLGRRQRRERTIELLRLVGISAPEQRLKQYPHQLSGGMRQRVIIAIALACEPRVLLADEPTTALDVSIQDQILRLLADLRHRLGMSMLIVSHDLGVIAQTCDRVMVMYGGQLVELAPVRQLVRAPRHPYTAGLLRSLPGSVPTRYLHAIPGMPPRLHRRPKTCTFRARCELATEQCESWETSLIEIESERSARCLNHALVRVDD